MVTLLESAQVIDAIKRLRELEGLDLKHAKDRLDAYVAQHPTLRARVTAQQRDGCRVLTLWLVALGAIGLIVIYALVT